MALTKEAHFQNQLDGGAVTVANSDDYGDAALYVAAISGMTAAYWQGSGGTSAVQFTGGETATATAALGFAGWTATGISCSFGLYLTALPTVNTQVAQFRTSAGNLVGVTITTAGKVNIATTNGSFSWTSTAVLSLNTWYRIDLASVISSTAGQVKAAVSPWASATALSGGTTTGATLNTGTAPVTEFRFGKLSSGGALANYFIRDIRVTDTTSELLGPQTGSTNQAPVANAGASQTATIGGTVTLSGTATDPDGTIASRLWEIVATPGADVTLSATNTGTVTFASTGLPAGDYRFRFTVADNVGASDSDETVVTLVASAPTVANAVTDSGYAIVDATGSTGPGTRTYSISPTTGTSPLGTGKWLVKQGTSDTTYTVTANNGSSSDTEAVVVPAQTAAGGTFTGGPITIQLPIPLDPATKNIWADILNSAALAPILDGLNEVRRYLRGGTTNPEQGTESLTRSGAQLLINGSAQRFSGANAYWLGLDDNAGDSTGSYPSKATITAAIAGMRQMGINLVRAHTIGISSGTSKSFQTAVNTYIDGNLDAADWAVHEAKAAGIRLMVPLTDNWNYYHGGLWWFVHQAYLQNPSGITDVDGQTKDDINNRQFFANTAAGLRIRALFKDYISHWLNHVNPYTGLAYKDDTTLAAIELGNEMYFAAQLGTNEWTQDIASFVKSIAPNKWVADGSPADRVAVSTQPGLAAAAVDIVGGHYYPQTQSGQYPPVPFGASGTGYPAGTALQQLTADATAAANAGKAFIVGEYPWTRSDIAAWYAAIESTTTIDGDLFWAMIGGTETHGGSFGSDDYPVHRPYLGSSETTNAPALAHHISTITGVALSGGAG
jgi:hypothetical protein